MKKVILILSILIMSININAQLMENPNITNGNHEFFPSYAAGFLSSSLVTTGTYVLTKNKYIAYAAGIVSGVATGYLMNKYNMSNGNEFTNRDVINGTYGAFSNVLCLSFILPKKNNKKELIEF